jgi:hypothetical protein
MKDPDPLREKERLQHLVDKSKAYKEVLKHRKKCEKWAKEYCEECFGGGLHRFVMKLYFKDGVEIK